MFLQLFLLSVIHVYFSFIVINMPILAAIAIALVHSYFLYCYLIITVHEGTHNLIFSSSNKKIEIWIKGLMPLLPLLAGFPGFTIYRKDHFLHHAYLSEDKDPQNSAFLNFRRIPLYYLKYGHQFSIKKFLEGVNPVMFAFILLIKIFHIILLYLLGGIFGVIFGFLLPFFLTAIFNSIRISFRHFNLYPNPKPLRARSYTFFGSSFIAPTGLRYHFEHHLFPNIPSYKLYKLYNFVEKKCPKEMIKAVHYKNFYWKDFW